MNNPREHNLGNGVDDYIPLEVDLFSRLFKKKPSNPLGNRLKIFHDGGRIETGSYGGFFGRPVKSIVTYRFINNFHGADGWANPTPVGVAKEECFEFCDVIGRNRGADTNVAALVAMLIASPPVDDLRRGSHIEFLFEGQSIEAMVLDKEETNCIDLYGDPETVWRYACLVGDKMADVIIARDLVSRDNFYETLHRAKYAEKSLERPRQNGM